MSVRFFIWKARQKEGRVEIREIWTPAGRRKIPISKVRRNSVHVLTGPNGSGKTETLVKLLDGGRFMSFPKGHSPSVVGAVPARVISQTFSPFSRFPPPLESGRSLLDYFSEYAADDLTYTCIGLHSRTRFVGSGLTKEVIEQAIYRLSEQANGVGAIFQVLRGLDLRDVLTLTYVAHEPYKLIAAERKDQFSAIYKFLTDLVREPAGPNDAFVRSLKLQLERTSLRDLAELIGTAFDVTERLVADSRLVLQLDGAYRKTLDFALLQALSLLRRVGLLELRSCQIKNIQGRGFDVAGASSGQQQMLCSIIGLAAALRKNSLVVVDEPELSLHPNWQMSYLDLLEAALAPHEGCHVFLATHSPLIVQRAQEKGVAVLQMDRVEEAEELSSRYQPPSVEGALLDVFHTPIAGSTYLANQILIAVTEGTSGKPGSQAAALEELERLYATYSRQSVVRLEQKELPLIVEAMELVREEGTTDD
jgi:ABC-type Mn2+/Zn2+ transport system ATPase subunit